MWNGNGERILWQIDSEWSDRGDGYRLKYSEESKRILSFYEREFEDRLSKDEYAWLAERGCVKTNGDYDGDFKSAWQIVVLDIIVLVDQIYFVIHGRKNLHLVFYSLASCSCGLVVIMRYSSVSLGKRSTNGRMTEP